MKALLINPPFPDTFWGYRYLPPLMKKKAVAPPLGLLTFASMLPENWDKKMADMNVSPLNEIDISNSDIVFITGMSIQKKEILSVISQCKRLNKKIVCGGWAFTISPEDFNDADCLILNESETTLKEFIKDLLNGTLKKVYKTQLKPEMDTVPVPAWSLINPKDYHEIQIQFSRGCPYKCDFCNVASFNGNQMRVKSPSQVITELQAIFQTGWQGTIFVVDDNINGNPTALKAILEEVVLWQKKNNFPFRFYVQASINCGKIPGLVELMRDANFYCVFLGIETPHLPSLLECNKTQNNIIDISAIIERFQKNGIMVISGAIVGFDNDPPDIAQKQIDFITNNNIVLATISMLEAKPNTELWCRLSAENRLNPDPLDGFLPNFKTKLGNNLIEKYYQQINNEIYNSPAKYYKRINHLFNILTPTNRQKLERSYVIKGALSMLIFSSSRTFFLITLIKTLLTKKRLLFLFIELSVKEVHFKKFTQKRVL